MCKTVTSADLVLLPDSSNSPFPAPSSPKPLSPSSPLSAPSPSPLSPLPLPLSSSIDDGLYVPVSLSPLSSFVGAVSNADLVEGWGILKREVFIAVWIVIFLSLSFYLFKSQANKINFKNIFAWFFLIFSLYLTSGLISSKNVRFLSGILPPEFYSIETKINDCPLGLNCFKDFEDGKRYAIENEKIILLDFTGWACANCRRMEENVWSKPAIFNLLDNNFIIISLYVDDRTKLSQDEEFKYLNKSGNVQYVNNVGRRWSLFQQINFNNASQPYYVAMIPSGKILTEPIQYTSEENFKNWLESSIEESTK